MTDSEDVLINVNVIGEDLRLLLVAASNQLLEFEREGGVDNRLRLAIQRVGSTGGVGDWHAPPPPDR